MSDESVVMATQGGPIAYTAAAYTSYAAKVMTKTRKLKAKGGQMTVLYSLDAVLAVCLA